VGVGGSSGLVVAADSRGFVDVFFFAGFLVATGRDHRAPVIAWATNHHAIGFLDTHAFVGSYPKLVGKSPLVGKAAPGCVGCGAYGPSYVPGGGWRHSFTHCEVRIAALAKRRT
jgi:hypothetical protein